MKVLVKTPLNTYSGYGNDGVGIVTALQKAGLDVYIQPFDVAPPLPKNVADLLQKRLVAPFDLTIMHTDPSRFELTEEARACTGMAVAWSMWEYSNLSNMRGVSKFKKSLKHFDVLLGYDDVSLSAMKERAPVKVKTGVLQGGFWPDYWNEVDRNWHNPEQGFWFIMVGALHIRKDPFAALQAFNELQNEYPDEMADVHLALKTNIPGLHPAIEQACKNVKIYYETWDDETLRAFYHSTHCLLSPSRGEGKNMPALEMQSTGGVVIATDWGGHKGWLDPQYAYPINYELRELDPVRYPGNLQARVYIDHLKSQMLHVVRNRDEAERKGSLAAQAVRWSHSWDNVMESFFQVVSDLQPNPGQALNAEYQYLKARNS